MMNKHLDHLPQVDFFAVELLDGSLYLLLDMGSGTIKVKATQNKVNDGAWYHVDIQRDGRSGESSLPSSPTLYSPIPISLSLPSLTLSECVCVCVCVVVLM